MQYFPQYHIGFAAPYFRCHLAVSIVKKHESMNVASNKQYPISYVAGVLNLYMLLPCSRSSTLSLLASNRGMILPNPKIAAAGVWMTVCISTVHVSCFDHWPATLPGNSWHLLIRNTIRCVTMIKSDLLHLQTGDLLHQFRSTSPQSSYFSIQGYHSL